MYFHGAFNERSRNTLYAERLVVVARCQTRTYTNNEGKKVYVTEFIVEDQEFAESKRAAGGEPETEKDGFMQMPEGEELPFN